MCYCLLRALNAVLITCLRYSTKDSLIERNLSWIEQSTLYKDNFLPLFFKTILFVCFPKAKPNPVPNFWVSKWNRYLQGVAIQMKVTEKYFPMVLFTMLYKVVRTVYETSRVRQFVWKLPNSNFLWYCLFCWARIFKLMILWMKKAWQFKRDLFTRAILLCCI